MGISKKLLAKHALLKHSEAAINQAAVAQAAANEIKSALEKSGPKPKKVQQELLKLIGQQNAAKRSATSSRRVSTEDVSVPVPVPVLAAAVATVATVIAAAVALVILKRKTRRQPCSSPS